MNIILENEVTNELKEKFMLVELDTFQSEPDGDHKKSFAVITKEEINIQEVHNIEMYVNLHNNLMKNYRLQNWKFCEDAIDQLRGKFRGEIDSFYTVLAERIEQLKELELSDSWNPHIQQY
jgi:hypothetical protein